MVVLPRPVRRTRAGKEGIKALLSSRVLLPLLKLPSEWTCAQTAKCGYVHAAAGWGLLFLTKSTSVAPRGDVPDHAHLPLRNCPKGTDCCKQQHCVSWCFHQGHNMDLILNKSLNQFLASEEMTACCAKSFPRGAGAGCANKAVQSHGWGNAESLQRPLNSHRAG